MREPGRKVSHMGKDGWSTVTVRCTRVGGELVSVMVVGVQLVLQTLFRRDLGSEDALRVVEDSWTRAESMREGSRMASHMGMASGGRASSWRVAPACTSGTG